jgi:hypothetical protein
MGKTRSRKPQKGLTFEDVWAALMETRKLQEETARQMKDTDRRMKETDRQIKETNKKMGDLGNSFGELEEHLVAYNIMEKFNDLHFNFPNTSQNWRVYDSVAGKYIAEVDLMLKSGDTIMAVEIRSKPLKKDVENHIRRIETIRRHADANNYKQKWKYQGAIAGAIMIKPVREYAHKTGLYVIEQTGDTVKINIPENFKPRIW